MSERDSLRVLRVLTAYLLIGCFLTGNVISACASSETSTDSGYSYRDDSNPVAESDHPYANNYENTWTISEPGADQIRLHFKYLKLGVPEKYSFDVYDKLILYDKYDNVLKTYGMAGGAGISKGVNLQDFYTEWYTGDTIKVKLVTDSSGTANGFVIDKTEIRMKETNGPDDSDDAKDVNPENKNKHEEKTSASVQLHGEKTDVTLGEDILLRLSAVNLITNPTMSVQIILIPPSGMSVTSSEFVQSGAGQYTTTYELEPGQGKDIEIRIKSNQVGNFNVNGRVIYYFDGDPEDAEDYTLNLPIKVKEGSSSSSQLPSIDKKNDVQSQNQTKSPGFGSFITLLGLLTFYTLKKRIL
ncbi:CUB domain-containing protein [Methanosarcina mazei]|nr:CUB domain-containing protein [Methanosarcina mazei]